MENRFDDLSEVRNPFNYDFVVTYGNTDYMIRANSKAMFPTWLAEHIANKIVQRQLGDGEDGRILDKVFVGNEVKKLMNRQLEIAPERKVVEGTYIEEKPEEFGGINEETLTEEELMLKTKKELLAIANNPILSEKNNKTEIVQAILVK